uniref:Glycoside hydrolase family 5 n=1 Tax=uncultured bacterium contig00061 TaxID=1181544 RepID=A0A806KCG4_9BACT|nr:glycoside hydrolase family 5 [uncultured bacterium contig00061]
MKGQFCIGLPAIVLALGMTVFGCDIDLTNGNGNEQGNGSGQGNGNGNGQGSGTDPRPSSPESMTAKSALRYFTDEGVKAGWNLGNSLDAVEFLNANILGSAKETAWGNPLATQQLLNGVKQSGFDIVRIPCSWRGYIGSAPDYKIDETRLRRVAEVVNMVHNAGMKAIINIHHDGNYQRPDTIGTWGFVKFGEVVRGQASNEQVKDQLGKVWTQIANYFKNYGDYLIFETLNEVHSGNWGNDYNPGYTGYSYANEQNILFDWNQAALSAIRATGGNNATRFVAVPGLGSTEPNIVLAADNRGKLLPNDPGNGTNKLIAAVHFYAPAEYTVADAASPDPNFVLRHTVTPQELAAIDTEAQHLKAAFYDKGIAVYYGEWGAPTNVRSTMSTTIKNNHVDYIGRVAKAARANGIVPIYWDDGGDFKMLERSNGRPKTGLWADTLNAYINAINTTNGPGAPSGGNGGGLEWGSGSISGTWTWGDYTDQNDGGSSTITMSEAEGKRAFSGNVAETNFGTYIGGYAGWYAIPNASTLPYLQAATSVSFYVKGDGKTYILQIPTSNITDYSYYRTTFTAPGTDTKITVNLNSLTSPGWGQSASGTSFSKQYVTRLDFQASEGIRPGTFSITIWGLEVNQ